MSMNVNTMSNNQNYSQFYRGASTIDTYGGSASGKKQIVKYEFNTTDENGNKIMDKMSREETLSAMKEIRSKYGDDVIVEFSGDGMAALVNSKKGALDNLESKQDMETKNAAFEKEIVHLDRTADYLPEYSGMYEADKTIATAVENCSQEEQTFVYDIIRQNFLVKNSGSLTEEERQANISLGMKKAEYAAEHFISGDQKDNFLDAMESVAKLASAGKSESNGKMDYGVNKRNYLGHGSNLVYTTDGLDMMRSMDSGAYDEYQRISRESSNSDRQLNTLKYLTNWYSNAVTKNPHMVEKYEAKSDAYIEKNVKNQKVDSTFSYLKTESKPAFIESLKAFQAQNPNFLSDVVNKELSRRYI